MTVLSSRDFTCIHPVVSKSSNKNEECRDLTDPLMGEHSCRYYHGVKKVNTHDQLAQCAGLQGAWDIEDLVQVGQNVKACPYHTARDLLSTAELVLAPYNYLVDPSIRESMNISLANHILILDEAHNIEDFSREAASCSITEDDLIEARHHLEQRTFQEESCKKLAEMLSCLIGWMCDNKDNIKNTDDSGQSSKIFSGTEAIAHLDYLQIGRNSYDSLRHCFDTATDRQDPEEPRLSPVAKTVLGNIFLVFNFLFKDEMKHKDDYKVAFIKEQKLGNWSSRSRDAPKIQYSLSFWCLNPAVAFSPIATVAHSIILTSGTLSPVASFESELGVSFQMRLEANHVIGHDQIFVGSLGHGVSGNRLVANYKSVDSWQFQDDLGELVLNVCQTVPGGVLCFVSSYALLSKLHKRWQSTNLWDEISRIKEALIEQKRGSDFEEDLDHFYTTIRNSQLEDTGAVTGVFFLAVHRGKVSEGMDFSDNNARAVISVGIPYLSIKDTQVTLKKNYNNIHAHARKLLQGNEWYENQAFRAINQSLGRCIRHRYDWGALLLVDYRFQNDVSKSNRLSKWVRNRIVHYSNMTVAISNLRRFVKNMLTNPPSQPTWRGEESQTSVQESALRTSAEESESQFSVEESVSQASSEVSAKEGKSKQSNDSALEVKKRQYILLDETDLEDFDLAMSPSTSQAGSSSFPLKKRARWKNKSCNEIH